MADRDITEDRLVRALPDRLDVPGVSMAYRLGAALVALLMVLLPLLYLALIAGIGWVVWWHATENVTMLQGKGSGRGRLASYLAPLFVGGVLLLFLVKPLFAPKQPRPQPLVLEPDDEPLLFAFVDKLCDAVGAPRPKAIHADCDLNASAGFHGKGDLVRGGRVLTVGLPLVAGMSLPQLAGVLAHEFGHFAQGTGTRLSWLIRSINYWFARVVYERDAWDARLEGVSKVGGWLSILGFLARGCVWLTRRVLFGLMWVARAVSSYLSRQMEFDADRYQMALVGSDVAESAFRRLAVLGPLWGYTLRRGWSGWDQRQLPADLPAFLRLHEAALSPQSRQELEGSIEEEKAELFATHPRLVERIEVARRAASPARFASELPASRLFRDFEALAHDVTRHYFATLLGKELRPEHLLATAALWDRQKQAGEDYAALRRFSQNMPSKVVPLRLSAASLAEPADALRQRLDALRQRVVRDAQAQDRACGAAMEACYACDNAEIAGLLVRAKVKIEPKAFGLDGKDQAAVGAARQRAQADLPAKLAEVGRLQAPLEERWSAVLGLLRQGGVAVEVGAMAGETERLLATLQAIGANQAAIDALRAEQRVVDALLRNLADLEDNDALKSLVVDRGARLGDSVRALAKPLDGIAYPFAHGKGPVTIAAHAEVGSIPPRDPMASVQAAGRLLGAIDEVYFRSLSRLAVAGEAVESSLGLEPLAAPKEENG